MSITMIIPALLVFALAQDISAQDGGVMNMYVLASKEVEINLKFGSNDFHFPVRPHRSLHMTFHPTQFTSDDYLHITVGLVNSYENIRDAKFLLVPSFSEEVLKFQNVNVTLQAHYKCNERLEGVRCSMKNVFRNPFHIPINTSVIVTEAPTSPTSPTLNATESVPVKPSNYIGDNHIFVDIGGLLIIAMQILIIFRLSIPRNSSNSLPKSQEQSSTDAQPVPPTYAEVEAMEEGVVTVV